jgi:hypothetical protein
MMDILVVEVMRKYQKAVSASHTMLRLQSSLC